MIYENDPSPGSRAIVGWGVRTGVFGGSGSGEGVRGIAFGSLAGVSGVNFADSGFGAGVYGESRSEGSGVFGISTLGTGVFGVSGEGEGVRGETNGLKAAVSGFNRSFTGFGAGVHGETWSDGSGVYGTCYAGVGVFGESTAGTGVLGITASTISHAVTAINKSRNGDSAGLYAKKEGPSGFAGYFDGRVQVTGDLIVVGSAIVYGLGDCAEDFDVAADAVPVEPGTVMVLGEDGALRRSSEAFDRRVVGVVSGAGDYQPAIVLDRRESNGGDRLPIALMGKVCCQADASYGAIAVGDLLTTSATPGHAMAARAAADAAGALIGKALAPLAEGRGLIPVLVTLG